MADRDIPSVPVTTLAGLTSLSDLLSELPISESSIVTSLNKSLLFHPRVAEEANNLLLFKDDNLTRQLVHAIEQTNSDHIELKNQYAEQPTSGTNINELPHLLQAIHTLKPTVFKTGGQQQQQRQIFQPISTTTQSYQLQQNVLQQNQFFSIGNNQLWNQQSHAASAALHNQPISVNQQQPVIVQVATPAVGQQQQSQSQQQYPVNFTQNQLPVQAYAHNVNQNTAVKSEHHKQDLQHQSVLKQSPISQKYHNQQMPLPIKNEVIVKQEYQPSVVQQQIIQQPVIQQSIIQQPVIQPVMKQTLSQQLPTQNQSIQSPVSKTPTYKSPIQQFPFQHPPIQTPNINTTPLNQSLTIYQQSSLEKTPNKQPSPIQQPLAPVHQINLSTVVGQQTQTQLVSNSHLHTPSRLSANTKMNTTVQAQTTEIHPNTGVIRGNNTQTQVQKMVPRNNEYLEKQSKNSDIRGGPSPAQASDAPESNQVHTALQQRSVKPQNNEVKKITPISTEQTTQPTAQDQISLNNCGSNASKIRTPKVSISRLKVEDVNRMEISIAEFTAKSPHLARKIGLLKDNLDTDVPVNADMFTQMKATERKAKKRLYNVDTEEEIVQFSQPKLRRIEMKILPSAKSSKEDVMKSQTYQQFMKNMEHELRRLEETEPPNNIDDLDYYSDCIPSKTLAQLANDVAKLKAKGAVDAIPKNKLILLINFAMRNIDVSRNFSAGPDMEDDIDDVIDKILDASEACLLVSNIYATAKDVKFLQEDNMDKIVKFVQFQMRETIFPSYDTVFTVKSMRKTDNRKKKSSGLSRSVQLLYTKLVELTKIFVTLFDNCSFVDTIVLAVSTLAVEPFFVDNIETLQFACLELVTTIFRKENYVKYRSSILNDILTSIDRLPCSKKNLRPYKLANNGGSIQMVTALVLQLIQCSSVLPNSLGNSSKNNKRKTIENDLKIDKDLLILEKYDTAFSIGGNFLTTFLNKCKSRSGETDFRPLFENFIYDLLTTVNKPEWPASELLLSLLGTLLVKYMSDKTIEQAIRVVSLEYLGIVAARLRKDTVESRCKVNTMDALIKCIKLEQEKEGDKDGIDSKVIVDPEEERTEFLQKILLDYLAVNAQEDNLIWDYARHFYLTQWYKDVMQKKKKIAEGEKGYASRKKSPKKRRRYKSDSESSHDEDESGDDDSKTIKANVPDQELNLEIFRILDERKKYFITKIKPFSSTDSNTVQDIKTYIDYSNAHLIAQYLASKRPFSQSFDRYLQKIILVVREPSIAIRTKVMKCLAMIVEVDPSILMRKDMQIGVNQKFLDTSISVREAAVDLVGKYVLSSSDLIDQYYEMLSKRILDTGVSVRKRVIKILRDICVEYPDFDKIPEICVKMIRRVNDEEGIQKLVTEVFMRMWFTPCAQNDTTSIERKINQMSDVVSMAHDTGTHWLDGLLKGIFTPKEEKDSVERNPNAPKKEPPKEVIKACEQLADGLVNTIIRFEGSDNKKVLSCITTLNLLAKVRPLLLVKHAMTLEPYLNIKGNIHHIVKFISFVAEILEQVVPLMEHPSESFLADLETNLMILVCSHNQSVVNSCLSCLGAIVNRITKNYKLIRDCFTKCYKPILDSRSQLEADPNYPTENIFKPMFRRGLFTIGLIFRFFDFKSPGVYGEGLGNDAAALPATICNDIFDHLIFFATVPNNEIRRETLIALGHFCIKNYDYLTNHKLRNFYCDLLTSNEYNVEIKINVLRNIIMYLHDADQSMSVKDKDWQTQSLLENLGDMGDVVSGMSSRIIQLYLRDVLNSLMHFDFNVRLWSMKVVQAVLRQGLVHPVQIVPYLICLSTDERQEIAHRADHHLQEIDKQYPGFVNMKCHVGIQLSFELQRILQLNETNRIVRGYCIKEKGEQPTALNGFLYTLLRSTRPQRRALVQSITKQFEEHKTTLHHMLYLADNLAYFPYTVQDEPLYIIHQIDLFISCTGTSILQTFKENLVPLPGQEEKDSSTRPNPLEDDDDDEDKETILLRLPEDLTELQKCIISAQGCILLLVLKQHLKKCYKLTEGKISRYSPSESAKIYEKAMQRQQVTHFSPKTILDVIIEQNVIGQQLSEEDKKELIDRYLDFKQLMLKIDKEDSDGDSDRPPAKTVTNTPSKVGNDVVNVADEDVHVNNVNNVIPSNTTVLPNKETSPANTHIAPPKSTPRVKQSTQSRKQPARSKRKARKVISSSEESDYSDEDYV